MQMVDFSANHDDRIFEDPEVFNIFRDDLYSGKLLRSGYRKEGRCSHMAFGVGPHLCPGAWISHQEAVEGSRILNKRMKNPRINLELQPKDPVEADRLAPIGLVSVRELYIDCDADVVLLKVDQIGGAACHTGKRSCFFRKLEDGRLSDVGVQVFDPDEVYRK